MELGPIGRLIFNDRYARKGGLPVPGALAVACPDVGLEERCLARVLRAREDGQIEVELEDSPGRGRVLPANQVDIPSEGFLEAVRRVADAVAGAGGGEGHADRYFKAIADGRFVPAGRIWAGAGVSEFLSVYNCTALPAPLDSRKGIVQTLEFMTELMSRGCGVGIPLMSLRPKHSHVRGVNGRSSGSVAWAELYAFSVSLIEQGGSRRGASILIQYDWHPDILEFIDAKRTAGRLTGANLSVAVSDALMEAVAAERSWELVFPDTSIPEYDAFWRGDLADWRGRGLPVRVHATLSAKELWRKICRAAHDSGEPGLLFIDRINAMSNTAYYPAGKIHACNPCVAGDTLISTERGLVPAAELVGEEVRIPVDPRMAPAGASARPGRMRMTRAGARVLKMITKEGYTLTATPDHKVLTSRGWEEMQHLHPGDMLCTFCGQGLPGCGSSLEEGAVLGWLVGDGSLTDGEAQLSFYGEKRALVPAFQQYVACVVEGETRNSRSYTTNGTWIEAEDRFRIDSARLFRLAARQGLVEDKLQVPEVILRGCLEARVAFLSALFSADGGVQGSRKTGFSVRLSSVSLHLLEQVQVLLQDLGIASRIYRDRAPAGSRKLPDGHGGLRCYECQAWHELSISRENMIRFRDRVGFMLEAKQKALEASLEGMPRGSRREPFLAEVAQVDEAGTADVYDWEVPGVHAFVANALIIHNCGEEPLPPWGVCNLGHVNLAAHLDGDGAGDEPAKIDWDRLGETVRLGVRFLDDVVALARISFPEQEARQEAERRIGLGTMGLGEALIRMHVRYGDNGTCLRFVGELYNFICREAYLASAGLAAERGAFPRYSPLLLEGGFARTLPADVREAIGQSGLRNAALLMQGPTGSVGTMIGTSTGIEPYMWLEWERKGRLGIHKEIAAPWREWKEKNGQADPPGWMVSAQDLSAGDHVAVQAAIQRWIDASISKTVNMPRGSAVEDVDGLYRKLYSLGCKGGTVYVDGSRDEQVLRAPAPEPAPASPPGSEVRPVPGGIYPMRAVALATAVGKLSVKLGLDPATGQPFEAWLDVSRSGTLVAADLEAVARLISLVLRLDSPVPPARRLHLVIDQLSGINGGDPVGFGAAKVLSVPDAVAKALAALVAAAEEETAEGVPGPASIRPPEACPSCCQAGVFREEGCEKCRLCGWSRCG